ncbi:hypothetical protein C9374_011869 [Naegleria lovaniensis]|uniref:Uncharacterized protein n=1 Tax=Naegleria lovaniensis TaxID=51637 RepID=A0AA88GE50_NAELO|nr:uncharacterized protein C9374_011869 [Naegleria lovaniensis]KAG2373780.1 hypothetical protein C9374_011869 [Naegleria lovaniensis]
MKLFKTLNVVLSTALEYTLLLPWYLSMIFHYYIVQYFKPYYLRNIHYGEHERNDVNIYYHDGNVVGNHDSHDDDDHFNTLRNNIRTTSLQKSNNTSCLKVLLFIHGGAWNSGDKLLYHNLGCTLRNYLQDHVIVICNYRKYSKRKISTSNSDMNNKNNHKNNTTSNNHKNNTTSNNGNSTTSNNNTTNQMDSTSDHYQLNRFNENYYYIEDQLQDVETCIEWIHKEFIHHYHQHSNHQHSNHQHSNHQDSHHQHSNHHRHSHQSSNTSIPIIDLSICGHSSGAHLSITNLVKKPKLAQLVNRVILLACVYDLEKQYQREVERGVENLSGLYRVMRGDLKQFSPYHMLQSQTLESKNELNLTISEESGHDTVATSSSSTAEISKTGHPTNITTKCSHHSLLHTLYEHNPNIQFHIVNGGQDTTVYPEYGNEFISMVTKTSSCEHCNTKIPSPQLFHVKHFENFNHADFVKLLMGIHSNRKECLEKKQQLLSFLKYEVLGYTKKKKAQSE